MAVTKRIIVLTYVRGTVSYALRADVPAGQEKAFAQPEYESCYGDVADPDAPGIVAGTIVEHRDQNSFVKLEGETTGAFRNRVQAALEARWQVFQDDVTAAVPMQFYGRYWNGTAWTAWSPT